MPGLGRPIVPEDMIIRGIILDSRDLFSKEAYEERIDKELAGLMHKYPPGSLVDGKGVREIRDVVKEFIGGKRDITGNKVEKSIAEILQELDDIKLKAAQEEILKIDRIRELLQLGSAGVYQKDFKKELEKFAKSIQGNTIAALKSNLRGEKRLRSGRAPLGYVLKKLKNDRYLDAEVAKRAYRIGEHTAEEHSIYYRVQDLIKMLGREPDAEVRRPLISQIESLIEHYKNDIEDFLNIEIDTKIEEARKLHRIDHYITFLKSRRYSSNANSRKNIDPLINQLNALKEWANKWVYQDTINAKKLQQYAIRSFEYGQKLLDSSQIKADSEFPGIVIEKHTVFEEFPGILIYNKNKPRPNRGLVLVHGAFATKESLLTLGKRLATQDFVVFSMDMASHGENTNVFRLGLISEHILMAVGFLRRNGIKNVGVVGHSLGAVCTLFAIAGYNARIEYQFFEVTAELMQTIDKIDKDLNKLKKKGEDYKTYFFDKAKYDLIRLSGGYRKLKEVILNGLREVYEGNSRIDAAVLLSAPKTCQFFFPKYIAGILKRLPKKTRKPVAKALSDILLFKGVEKLGESFTIPEYVIKGMNEEGKVRIVGADVTNMYETFDYVQNLKNPYDYMDAIKKICKKFRSPDKRVDFIRFYTNLIRSTPKLCIYGLGDIDILLKSFISRRISELGFSVGRFRIDELEAHYKDFGGEIIRIPNLNHSLTIEGNLTVFDVGRMPKITYKIVTFFNQYLGRGRII